MNGAGAKGREKAEGQSQDFNSPSQVYFSSDSQTYIKYSAGMYENGQAPNQFYVTSLQPTQVFTTNDLPSGGQTFQELTPVTYQRVDHNLDRGNQQSSHQMHQLTELRNAIPPEHVQQMQPPSCQRSTELQPIGESQQNSDIQAVNQQSEVRTLQTIGGNQQLRQLQMICGNQQVVVVDQSRQYQTIQPHLQTISECQPMQTISANQQMQRNNPPQQLQPVAKQINGNQHMQIIAGQVQQIHQLPEQNACFPPVQNQTIVEQSQPNQIYQQKQINSEQNNQMCSSNGVTQNQRNFNEGQSDKQADFLNQSNGSDKGKKRNDSGPSEDGTSRNVRKKKRLEELESADVIMRLQKSAVDDYPIELTNENDVIINFDEKDLPFLLTRMEKLIPKDDVAIVRNRMKKIDWQVVAFGEYSPCTVREAWNVIMKKLRQHRVLHEFIDDAKSWVDKPWKDFFRTKPVVTNSAHPDLPKKPSTSYLLYYQDRKGEVITENPGIKMQELTQLIATEFHGLSEIERNKYAMKAAAQRRDYEAKLKEFHSRNPLLLILDRAKGEHKPKKHTPFNLYYQEQLKNLPVNERTNTFKESCKVMWKELPEENKLFWIDAALELERQQSDGGEDKSTESSKDSRPILLKAERELKDKLAGKPVRPPISAYGLFSRMVLKGDEMKKIDAKERLRMIAVKWKDLPNEEKEQLRAQTTDAMNEYKRQFDVYIKSLPPAKQEEELRKAGSKKKKITPKCENPNSSIESYKSPEGIKNESFDYASERIDLTENVKPKVENFDTRASENAAYSSTIVKEEVVIKRERIETRHLLEAVIPVTWDDMANEERSVYIKYIEKIRHYFDTQHQSALQQVMIKKEKCESD